MKKALLITTTFLGAAVIGGVGYKFLAPCPKIGLPTCAIATQKAMKAGHVQMAATAHVNAEGGVDVSINTDMKCPAHIALDVAFDMAQLTEEQRQGAENFAHVTHYFTKVEGGQKTLTLTAENFPPFKILPTGKYILTVKPDLNHTNLRERKFWATSFGIDPENLPEAKAVFEHKNPAVTLDQQLAIHKAWNNFVSKFANGTFVRQDLADAYENIGPYTSVSEEEKTTYTFTNMPYKLQTKGPKRELIYALEYFGTPQTEEVK